MDAAIAFNAPGNFFDKEKKEVYRHEDLSEEAMIKQLESMGVK